MKDNYSKFKLAIDIEELKQEIQFYKYSRYILRNDKWDKWLLEKILAKELELKILKEEMEEEE